LRTRLETPFDLACCIAFTAAYKKSIAKFKYKKISINQNFSFKVTIEIKKYLFPDNTKVISGIKSNISDRNFFLSATLPMNIIFLGMIHHFFSLFPSNLIFNNLDKRDCSIFMLKFKKMFDFIPLITLVLSGNKYFFISIVTL
jgi:hypothetical protein